MERKWTLDCTQVVCHLAPGSNFMPIDPL